MSRAEVEQDLLYKFFAKVLPSRIPIARKYVPVVVRIKIEPCATRPWRLDPAGLCQLLEVPCELLSPIKTALPTTAFGMLPGSPVIDKPRKHKPP